MKHRLGCFSAAGIAIAVAALSAVIAWSLIIGPGLFSAGELNAVSNGRTLGGVTSHASLTDCGVCHTSPWSSQTMAEKCWSCHTDVRAQTQSHTGLHGRLITIASSATCRGCHTEHRGSSAKLTVLNVASFPHDATGYSLKGHRRTANGGRFECVDCHAKDLAHFDQASCAECHAGMNATFMSQHEAAFGKTCLLCHNGTDRVGADFDHNKLAFKLTGKHARVPCEGCHTSTGPSHLVRNTPQDCYSCHAKVDKHAGAFGRQCGQCHTPNGWGEVSVDHKIFPVDHGTRVQSSTCLTCHPNGVSTYTCFGCHAHTPASVTAGHEGRALADLTDCIRCHAGGRREGGD